MEHSFNNLEFYTNIIEEYENKINEGSCNAEKGDNKDIS